jgi:outer membrane protein OmpA-like peptidoglycan-associated protein
MKKQLLQFALALVSVCALSACSTTSGTDFTDWMHNKFSTPGYAAKPQTLPAPLPVEAAAPVMPVQEETPVDLVKPVTSSDSASSGNINGSDNLVWHQISNYNAANPSLPVSSLESVSAEEPVQPGIIKYGPSVDVYPVGGETESYAPRITSEETAGDQFNVNQMIQQVFFPYGSSRISKIDHKNLRELAQSLKRSGSSYKLNVVGHASKRVNHVKDPVKRQMINFKMAQKRANAVAQALIKSGASPDYVEATSVGDSQPNTHRHGKSHEAADRRAEIYLNN